MGNWTAGTRSFSGQSWTKSFLLPNGFLDGGVTGISILLSKITGIEISIILPIISIRFFVIGWFTISRKTVIRSIISVLVLSLIIHFENFQYITEDKLLISIFGGLFQEFPLVLSFSGSTWCFFYWLVYYSPSRSPCILY